MSKSTTAEQSSVVPSIDTPLKLPNGISLPNRIVKSAMEEELARYGVPSEPMYRLYQRWSQGGAGLLITGNVMVDRRAPTDSGVAILENAQHLDAFKAWAKAGKKGGNPFIMQINHPGRQIPNFIVSEPVAPSAVGLEVPGGRGLFNAPRALSDTEVELLIERYVTTATLAMEAGFDGVQVHAAHGYLISQFLSPLTNLRTDKWGGSIEQRSRFLFEVLEQVRQAIGASAILSIKLNSADFQRGGFSEEDALWVVERLNKMDIDLLEISGGNYESPAMIGDQSANDPNDQNQLSASTQAREAFFLDFAAKAKAVAKMPVMVTGGFRSRQGVMEALSSGAVDAVGLAKPFCMEPDLPRKFISGELEAVSWPVKKLKNQAFNSLATMGWARAQIHRLAHGKAVEPKLGTISNLLRDIVKNQIHARQYRRWLKKTL